MKGLYTSRFQRCCATLFVLATFSCSDFLDIDTPSTQIARRDVYQDDAAATSTINGIYSEMMFSSGFASGGISSVTLLAGRSADDFVNHSKSQTAEFSSNNVTDNNNSLRNNLWREAYRYIYFANSILEGLEQSQNVTVPVRKQLKGEALFVRAFCHLYLVNLFGDVPLLTGTDFRINSEAHRSASTDVYDQIVSDLAMAKELLAADYSFSANQRTRPNRWAASALLSRVHLYRNDWSESEEEASAVIDNPLYSLEGNLNAVFLKNSKEAIWQLIPHEGTINTREGATFILTATPTELSLSNSLLRSFEDGDLRNAEWIRSIDINGNIYHYPYKYKVKSGATMNEYSMVLRVAEQYLIRAEARAQLDNIEGAISDLDAIRQRAGLPRYQDTQPGMTKQQVLTAIENERRIELFSEWGHRWLDLKRTGKADEVLGVEKGPDWQPTDVLYPIPFSEIQNNRNLLPQNPGY